MLAEQRAAQTKWLKGTLVLRSEKFGERSDVTRELRGLPCGRHGTAKFEFKSPSDAIGGPWPSYCQKSRQ
ncbi:hypothetical protein E2C01_076724 [Portunus trituberculatus]|uniref:Uncharacterized protein n=1 Tax=Portunus trituberculatus TaxID=210409 RepID=A0A5B7IMS4_PORTR|nr:hypothetical protein [Portunus trituberculatus]